MTQWDKRVRKQKCGEEQSPLVTPQSLTNRDSEGDFKESYPIFIGSRKVNTVKKCLMKKIKKKKKHLYVSPDYKSQDQTKYYKSVTYSLENTVISV